MTPFTGFPQYKIYNKNLRILAVGKSCFVGKDCVVCKMCGPQNVYGLKIQYARNNVTRTLHAVSAGTKTQHTKYALSQTHDMKFYCVSVPFEYDLAHLR